MKFVFTLLFAISSVLVQAQFSFVSASDSMQVGIVDQLFEFHHWVRNNGNEPLVLRWRLYHSFAGVEEWEDNVCEGTKVCFPSNVRSDTFLVEQTDSFELIHDIKSRYVEGSGSSTLCVFDPSDSAATVSCLTVHVQAIMPDTHQIYVDGKEAYVIDGDTFEIFGGNYVPLGVAEPAGATKALKQNIPNPFRNQTTIPYQLSGKTGRFCIHDVSGKRVFETELYETSGTISIGESLLPGVYFYSLFEDGKKVSTKKMQIVK